MELEEFVYVPIEWGFDEPEVDVVLYPITVMFSSEKRCRLSVMLLYPEELEFVGQLLRVFLEGKGLTVIDFFEIEDVFETILEECDVVLAVVLSGYLFRDKVFRKAKESKPVLILTGKDEVERFKRYVDDVYSSIDDLMSRLIVLEGFLKGDLKE